jgi:hypothetical protein
MNIMIMNRLEELQDDLRIAEHNVWVAKTVVDDMETEVRNAQTKITNYENKLKLESLEIIDSIQTKLDQDGYAKRETDGQ